MNLEQESSFVENPAEKSITQELQEELLKAYETDDKVKIAQLKKRYEEEFQGQLEGVECLFGLVPVLKIGEKLELNKLFGGRFNEQAKKALEEVTQYNFLLTDFISNNTQNKKTLEYFWKVIGSLARKAGAENRFQSLKKGILSQVAAMKIYEQLGFNPQLSHPKEDAFEAIDLWVDRGNTAVQIKGGNPQRGPEPKILETDTITFPGITFSRMQKVMKEFHINSSLFNEAERFHVKLEAYRRKTQRNIKGFLLYIPYNKIDLITGEPAPELVEFVRKNINLDKVA